MILTFMKLGSVVINFYRKTLDGHCVHTLNKGRVLRPIQRDFPRAFCVPAILLNWQVEQKPGESGRGRGYNYRSLKIHCDSIIKRSCWIIAYKSLTPSFPLWLRTTVQGVCCWRVKFILPLNLTYTRFAQPADYFACICTISLMHENFAWK